MFRSGRVRSQARALLVAPALFALAAVNQAPKNAPDAPERHFVHCEDQGSHKPRVDSEYKIKVKANLNVGSASNPTNLSNDKTKRDFNDFLIVAGSANGALSKDICDILGTRATPTDVWQFSDGELSCIINDTVRGKDVCLIQSFGDPVNDNIMELLLTISALRRSGANNITAVIPYFGYKFHRNRGLPITTPHQSRFMWNSAADIAKMLRVCGVDKIISIDLQRAGQNHEACFFENVVPVETVDSTNIFVE